MTSFLHFNVFLLLLCFGLTIAKEDLPTDFVEKGNTKSATYTEKGCYVTSDKGAGYRGTVSVTKTGRQCQNWASQTPHNHGNTPEAKPDSGLVTNYCRNPDNSAAPWCYTTDPEVRWEFCDIPICGACPQTSYKFPNREQTTNYIRVTKPIPDLHEFTMCGWLTRSTNGKDCWISYANDDDTNAFLLVIPTDKSTRVCMKDKCVDENLTFERNTEYHICFAIFASSTGNAYVFVNGQLEDIFQLPSGILKGSGVFVIGQDQDVIGGGFDPSQSSQGKLSNFMVWNKVFEFDDYQKMHENRCHCPGNYIFSLENENIELFGGATAVLPHVCPQ